jgi:hypothetical protein
MYLKANNQYKLILAIIILLTIILGGLILMYPPAVFPDPSWGFQVMRSMQLGGGFNLAISPSQDNVAQNTATFLTWWSPGQYLLPYFFKTIFGINQGQSAAVTILFCDLLGIWGFYSLFRKLGFSQRIAALSILFIVCQQFYVIPYIFYNGGETLLFGFLGWFLYGCFSFKTVSWKAIIFILLSGWVGFFCKSAFLWMYASGLLCLWVNISSGKTQFSHWIKNGIVLAIPAVISLATIYKFFLSRGVNPASASPGFHFSLEALGFPLASPLLSGFSVDELVHGLIYHSDTAIFNPAQTTALLILLIALSVGLYIAILRLIPNEQYKLVVSAFYAVSILFFSSVFLRQLDISYEGRHFRLVGLLFIPGAIYLFSKFKPAFKAVFILLWIGIAITSANYFISDYKNKVKTSAYGPSGISQFAIDQQALNYLQNLDKQHPNNALFAFISADLGLDIIHNRIITLDDMEGEDANTSTYTDDNLYDGHAGPLFILLPAYYATNGNAAIIQKCFPGYSNFSTKKLSKNYILLSAP